MNNLDEPLVLISGHLCDERLWTRQTMYLAGRVSAIHVMTPGPHRSIAALADDVASRLPAGPFALAGFSLGGMIALELMVRMPERISRLALIDTTARAAAPAERDLSVKNVTKVEKGDLQTVVAKFITFLHAPAVLADRPDLVAETMTMMMSRAEDCYVPQQIAMRDRPDRRALLADIACPTLVLCGERDIVTPLALHEEMAALIPGAKLQVIPAAGHMITSESPDDVASAFVEWLDIAALSGLGWLKAIPSVRSR